MRLSVCFMFWPHFNNFANLFGLHKKPETVEFPLVNSHLVKNYCKERDIFLVYVFVLICGCSK